MSGGGWRGPDQGPDCSWPSLQGRVPGAAVLQRVGVLSPSPRLAPASRRYTLPPLRPRLALPADSKARGRPAPAHLRFVRGLGESRGSAQGASAAATVLACAETPIRSGREAGHPGQRCGRVRPVWGQGGRCAEALVICPVTIPELAAARRQGERRGQRAPAEGRTQAPA